MNDKPFVKIDSHAHLTSDKLYPNIEGVLERALKQNVQAIININTDRNTFERGLELKKKYPHHIFNTVATTPHDVEKEGKENFSLFEKAIRAKQVVAIGEIGLDYYYEHSRRDIQKEFLKRYFDLAVEVNVPVVIHCRGDEAFLDLFQFSHNIQAVLHCFTGSLAQAQEALERGWYISISGIATFKKSTLLCEVIKKLPLNRLLIETDSPYLAPQSKRGTINEPSNVGEIAEIIAQVQNTPLEEVCKQTTENARAFFCISLFD